MAQGDGGGHPPYGWTATGGGRDAFAPVPREIDALKMIRELRSAGLGSTIIARRLDAAGHTRRAGRPWTARSVRASLLVIERFGIPKDVPAAIKSAWEKARKKEEDNHRTKINQTPAKKAMGRQ